MTMTTPLKAVVLAAIRDAWRERLRTTASLASSNDDDSQHELVAAYKAQTLAQVHSLYGHYHAENDPLPSNKEMEECVADIVQAWRDAPPSTTATSAAPKPKSFSLLDALGGGGGLSAFFSWSNLTQDDDKNDDAAIWQALTRLEYLEDAWPDWSTEIRPWIQARLAHTANAQRVAWCRAWYGKGRKRHDSPEIQAMLVDILQDVFVAVDQWLTSLENEQQGETTLERQPGVQGSPVQALLEVGLDMVTDHFIVHGGHGSCAPLICFSTLYKASTTCDKSAILDVLAARDEQAPWMRLFLQSHPTLYREVGTVLDLARLVRATQQEATQPTSPRFLYLVSLWSHLLLCVRVAGLSWDTTQTTLTSTELQVQVYRWLWQVVRQNSTTITHLRDSLYVQGLEALLAGCPHVRAAFQKDWVFIGEQRESPALQPLRRFAKA